MSPVMTLNDAARHIRERGIPMSNDKLADGIEQGAYPFGVCIRLKGSTCRTFDIYRRLLDRWLDERATDSEDAKVEAFNTDFLANAV